MSDCVSLHPGHVPLSTPSLVQPKLGTDPAAPPKVLSVYTYHGRITKVCIAMLQQIGPPPRTSGVMTLYSSYSLNASTEQAVGTSRDTLSSRSTTACTEK